MKKKLLAILLAAVMMMAMLPTAFAADEEVPSVEDGLAPVSFEFEKAYVEQAETLYGYNAMSNTISTREISGLHAVKSGTEITVSHAGNNDSSVIFVYYYSYTRNTETTLQSYYDYDADETKTTDFKGKYFGNETFRTFLCDKEPSYEGTPSISDEAGHYWTDGFIDLGPDGISNPDNAILLQAGESVTFMLPDDGSDTIYLLYANIYYPQYDYIYWWYFNVVIDDDLYNNAVSGDPEDPETPDEPETPEEPETPDVSFEDVPAGIWYEKAVNWAVSMRYVNGVGNNRFAPTNNCTHEHILTMLYRADRGGDVPASAADMDAAVIWAQEKGMIGDSFDRDDYCTRADAVKYIWYALNGESGLTVSFDDVDADADYADAVAWAVKVGIADPNGTGNNQFTPDKVCNRGTIATFLLRAYVLEERYK